jgi:hypothetical protein
VDIQTDPLPNFLICAQASRFVGGEYSALLPQLRVFCFGLFQDGGVEIGIFPEGEEIFLGSERPDAGGIGIGTAAQWRFLRVSKKFHSIRQRSPQRDLYDPSAPDRYKRT